MGAQAVLAQVWLQSSNALDTLCSDFSVFSFSGMAPMKAMKAMKTMKAKKAMKASKAMTKGALADALAVQTELKKAQCSQIIDSLAAIATKEVKSSGKFILPGLFMIKTRLKPAQKAGIRHAFGKEFRVKAKPARTIVKAYCVAALKKSV